MLSTTFSWFWAPGSRHCLGFISHNWCLLIFFTNHRLLAVYLLACSTWTLGSLAHILWCFGIGQVYIYRSSCTMAALLSSFCLIYLNLKSPFILPLCWAALACLLRRLSLIMHSYVYIHLLHWLLCPQVHHCLSSAAGSLLSSCCSALIAACGSLLFRALVAFLLIQ